MHLLLTGELIMYFKRWLRGPGMDGQTQVEIQCFGQDLRTLAPIPILDAIYADLESRGETQGIQRLSPGHYMIEPSGWL